MLCCDWQKQQNFSQVHCDSGLSHCEQRTVKVWNLRKAAWFDVQ